MSFFLPTLQYASTLLVLCMMHWAMKLNVMLHILRVGIRDVILAVVSFQNLQKPQQDVWEMAETN